MSLVVERPAQPVAGPNAEARPGAFAHFITPAELRFVRCHFPVPAVSDDPPLAVGGAVARPLALRASALRELTAVAVTVTTECAGNGRFTMVPRVPGEPWMDGAVSTAQWTGAPLRTLLEQAGLLDTAVEIVCSGADRQFERSLPLEKALEESTLLAWEMNGAPIPSLFGGPLRLIVPGWYGMASVKWLSRIEAVTAPFTGRFQTERYLYAPGQPVRQLRVKSMFTDPPRGAVLRRGAQLVRGLAWGGQGGVARVQVAAGNVWREARLVGPALPHAWRRFELPWAPERPGRYTLRCRAISAAGEVQPEFPLWNALGYGANGVQGMTVTVL